MCRRIEVVGTTVGLPRHRNLVWFCNVPVQAPSRDQPFYGTGQGVRRSNRSLSACHTRRKCSLETSYNSVKVEVGKKVTDWYRLGGGLFQWESKGTTSEALNLTNENQNKVLSFGVAVSSTQMNWFQENQVPSLTFGLTNYSHSSY